MMRFSVSREEGIIRSDDPSIYVADIGKTYELGPEFLLVWDQRQIGFRTCDFDLDDQSGRLNDGTKVWWFDRAFCPIHRTYRTTSKWKNLSRGKDVLTNTYKLESQEEVMKAIEIFSAALSYYGGERETQGVVCAEVRFSDKVLAQIEAEEFVLKPEAQ